jgi:hypothetical protein
MTLSSIGPQSTDAERECGYDRARTTGRTSRDWRRLGELKSRFGIAYSLAVGERKAAWMQRSIETERRQGLALVVIASTSDRRGGPTSDGGRDREDQSMGGEQRELFIQSGAIRGSKQCSHIGKTSWFLVVDYRVQSKVELVVRRRCKKMKRRRRR